MKEWLLPSFGTFVLWGLWNFIPKVTTRYISPKSAVFFQAVGGILFATIVLYSLKFKPDIHPKGVILAITTGILGFAGALFYLYAASKGPISLVAVLASLCPVITVVLAMVFLGESISVKQGLGIILAFVSLVLIAT